MYGNHVDSGFVLTDGDKKYVMLVDEHCVVRLAAIYLYTGAENIMRPISDEDFMLAGGIIALAKHLGPERAPGVLQALESNGGTK